MSAAGMTSRALAGIVMLVSILLSGGGCMSDAGAFRVGAARVDITPEEPIRLMGYASRQAESEGIEQKLWAKALVIEDEPGRPAVLITVDNCAVPAPVTEEVARRLERAGKISRERLTVCSSHTHAGPCLKGALATMFGYALPEDQQAKIDRYTQRVTDAMEKVALAALDDRHPVRLEWGCGHASFAINRRAISGQHVSIGVNPDGPVDRSLPVLRATDADGRVRAVLVNYACHCTTLNFNRICGDWAGYAQEYVERDHPEAVCLVAIGCGGDANPHPRGELELAKKYGQEIATEVSRLFGGELKPIRGDLTCRFERIRLAFGKVPGRDEWEKRAEQNDYVGYHAKVQLAKLDRGEALPTHLDYPVQTWAFGDDLAMVFLAGEVVVDYVLRLKKELDGERLWVTAYANDVPCYIPSRRVLAEGGYEAEGSMTFYDLPGRLAPEVEDRIISAVQRQIPETFKSSARRR